jgi:hypothetical protein
MVVAACIASAASATSGSKLVPTVPMQDRTETVTTETAIEGLDINATPAGAAAWTIAIRNDTDEPVSVLWDESSFVTASGDSGGRLIRGETRRIDSAKAQPPTPVPAHARASEIILIEKLTDAEKLEDEYSELAAKYGGVTESMNRDIENERRRNLEVLRGGRIDLRIEVAGAKRTWSGRVSGGKAQGEAERAEVVAPKVTGFFCSRSPSNGESGFCVRDKAECTRTRDVSLGALPDLTECALVETAWCLDKLCFPSEESCLARSRRTPDGKCVEAK